MRVTATLSGWELLLRRNTHHDRFTIMSNLKFLHFPVAAKAVLLIAALGLLSIAANWFCLERLDEFDRLNAPSRAIWRLRASHSPRPHHGMRCASQQRSRERIVRRRRLQRLFGLRSRSSEGIGRGDGGTI